MIKPSEAYGVELDEFVGCVLMILS
jgi:hypothetical protein